MDSTRRARHALVSAALDGLDDDDLTALLDAASAGRMGVGGGTAVLDVHGVAVFAKRIPITDRELAHPHSTANLFGLPTFCQYGMHRLAGPGFGAWRELAANLSVTEGVLAGESEAFALLHHWRVLPGRPPSAAEHQDIEAVAFLRGRELLHMDGHFGNMRADEDQIYLVDLGLATSPRFELSEAERDFVARHVDHDGDYAAMRLVNWLVTTVCGAPTPSSGGPVERDAYVRRCAAGDIPAGVPPVVAGILTRHAGVAAEMNAFHWRLVDGDIQAQYPGSVAARRRTATQAGCASSIPDAGM